MSGPEQEQQQPRCWSYSAETLERCALDAGHALEHEVVRYTRWNDAGAWTPINVVPDGGHTLITPVVVDDLDRAGEGGCYNCPHPEHDGPCMVLVTSQQVECGCTFRSL